MIASEAGSSGMTASEAPHSWDLSFTIGSGETDLEGHKLER